MICKFQLISKPQKRQPLPSKRLPFPVPVLLLASENFRHHLCPQLKTINEHFRELKRDYVKLFVHDFNEPLVKGRLQLSQYLHKILIVVVMPLMDFPVFLTFGGILFRREDFTIIKLFQYVLHFCSYRQQKILVSPEKMALQGFFCYALLINYRTLLPPSSGACTFQHDPVRNAGDCHPFIKTGLG